MMVPAFVLTLNFHSLGGKTLPFSAEWAFETGPFPQPPAAETPPSYFSTQAGTYRIWNILNSSKTQGKVINSFPEHLGPPCPSQAHSRTHP